MNKIRHYRSITLAAFISFAFIAYCSLTIAGGGGASLDSNEGLDRAADNFLVSFVLLAKTKDINLTPINEVEHNLNLSGAVDFVEYQSNDSLWNYIIMFDWNFTSLPQSTDRSHAEKTKFRNDYIARKQQKSNLQHNSK